MLNGWGPGSGGKRGEEPESSLLEKKTPKTWGEEL